MAFSLFKKKNTGADSIYYGGTVITQDPNLERATAVACKNGRVIALGNDEEILQYQGESTLMVELEGEYLIPGLLDPAGHPVLQVFSHCSLYLSNRSSREEILDGLKLYIDKTPAADSYFGYGFCMHLLEGHTMEEAAALLDQVHSETPIVLLSDGGNGVWLNTVAIEAVRQSAEKDMIQNINLPYILYSIAPFDNAALEKEAILLGEKYKRLGFTSVLSCGEPDYMQGLYQQCLVDLYQCETHLQRYFGAYLVNANVSPGPLMQRLLQKKTTCMELDDNFNYNMVQLIVDTTGEEPTITRENLMEICVEAGDKSFDIHMDVVGSDALVYAVEAIARMRNSGYRRNTVVIAHQEDLIKINQTLESPISFEEWQIVETAPTIGSFPANVESRLEGGHLSFLPDFSRFEEAQDLIDYHTTLAAEMIGFENQLGMIKNGYYADFAVFKKNPLDCFPEDFDKLEVTMTVINGMPTKIGDLDLDEDFFDELEDFDEDRAGLDGMRGLDNLGGIV